MGLWPINYPFIHSLPAAELISQMAGSLLSVHYLSHRSHKVVARTAVWEPSVSVLIITYANYFLIFFFSIIALLFIGGAASFISATVCAEEEISGDQPPNTPDCILSQFFSPWNRGNHFLDKQDSLHPALCAPKPRQSVFDWHRQWDTVLSSAMPTPWAHHSEI